MPKFTINTGREFESYPIDVPTSASEAEKKVVYPSLFIEGGAELKNIPESGEALIKFKRASKTVRQNDDEAPKCSIELEVTELTVHNYEEEKTESAQEAFDKIASEVRKGAY